MLRAAAACTFSTSEPPKVVRAWCVLYIFTSKSASHHNGVHFFNISTSKGGPNPQRFVYFNFETYFAPQRHTLFQHLNFQKWSEPLNFNIFDLEMYFAPQRRVTFHLISPDVSAPAAFSEPTFQPSGATIPRKNTVFRDFPFFSRICIFFLLIFSFLIFLPANYFFICPYCRKFNFQISFNCLFNYFYFLLFI